MFDNLEFHNLVVEKREGFSGVFLPRYPDAVRATLSERGRFVSMESTGGEIRFVTPAKNVRIYLSSLDNDSDVHVYRGDFHCGTHRVVKGATSVIHLEVPARFAEVKPEMLAGTFSPDVWRIRFNRFAALLHDVDAFGFEVRPPSQDEKPARTLLAYGSSITHSNANGYPQHAARLLKTDMLNKGLSGACHCEPQAASFIASLAWDYAFLELGVNMRGGYTPDDFRSRAEHLIDLVLARRKPVAVTTIYPNFSDYELHETTSGLHDKAYSQILRDIVSQKSNPLLHRIEGADVLSDVGGLSADLIHPGDFGHALMGANLARILSSVFGI
ncbi:MAG: lysophospholipase [Spirochaetes bacterium]|nr:lysophospholipase [Spirochaetota bacterium]